MSAPLQRLAVALCALLLLQAPALAEEMRYSLQTGSYTSLQEARDAMYTLRSQGMAPCVLKGSQTGEEPLFTVQVADYASREEALSGMRLYCAAEMNCTIQALPGSSLMAALDCSLVDTVDPNQAPELEVGLVYEPELPEEPEIIDWNDDLDEDGRAFAQGEREKKLLTARTLAQNDYTAAAMEWYATLLQSYPDDEEIRDYYIDTLIRNHEYAKAEKLLLQWLKNDDDNVRAIRLLAVLYTTVEAWDESYGYWERLHELRPDDMGFVTDHAFARRDGGDWERSLELFSQVQDNDEENTIVAEMMQELLKEHRPRYSFGVESYLQANNGLTLTWSQSWGQHLISERNWVEVFYDMISVTRPRVDADTDPINEFINDARVRLTHRFTRDLDLIFGVGGYYVDMPGVSIEAGIRWRLHQDGTLLAMGQFNRPWIDTIEAPANEGRYKSATLSYEGLFDDRWLLTFISDFREYSVTNYDPYAWRTEIGGSISRRLAWRPDVWLTYGFRRVWNVYAQHVRPLVPDPNVPPGDPEVLIPLEDRFFRPVALVDNEEAHTISALIEDWPCKYIGYSFTGGVTIDTFKDKPAFFLGPTLRFRLGQRVEANLGALYSSDSDEVGGGETLTTTLDITVLF